MLPRHTHLLRPETTLLVVVDMQDAFLRAMHSPESLLANVRLLIQSMNLLGVPLIATTQNASRLGKVTPALTDILPTEINLPIDKMTFSCAGSDTFLAQLEQSGRKQILLCGVETHICITQTALDLAHLNYQVHVAADAVSSRTLEKHKLGMERLRDSSVLPCAAEAAVYELLGTADTPAFKPILSLVK